MEIKIENLSKKYEGNIHYTLKDLNLDIDNKDFCVLLGPSGCGKTTLLRMIAGLNSVTSGDLLFDGNRVNELSPKDRGIAMVFQSYALYPHMNVYKNISFGLKLAKEKKEIIDRRVKDVAKILNIGEVLYKKPGDLSGGQRQRVALGRAIARKPDIFLMDEPLSNLDAKLREKMRTELVRIHKMLGTTSIYVTHDQLEAMTMATKIVLMNNQTIVQIGSPEEVFQKPNSLFAARFIGSPSMNIIEGEIKNGVFVSDDNLIKVKPSKKHLDLMKNFKLTKVCLGFRANDLTVTKTAKKGDLVIKSQVIVAENLGSEVQLSLDISDKNTITALTKNKTIEADNTVYLTLGKDHFHFFDIATEQRVTNKYPELKDKWIKHQAFLQKQKDGQKQKTSKIEKIKNILMFRKSTEEVKTIKK